MPRRADPRSESVKVPIALPRAQYEWLREFAFHRRVSMAEIVREALGRYRNAREDRGQTSRARTGRRTG